MSKEESKVVIVGVDDNDSNIKKLCTIPERMKIVFDDWGVKYNKEVLDKAIKDTKEALEKADK